MTDSPATTAQIRSELKASNWETINQIKIALRRLGGAVSAVIF